MPILTRAEGALTTQAPAVLGCISVIWIASALTVQQSVGRYGQSVRQAAEQIAARYVAERPRVPAPY